MALLSAPGPSGHETDAGARLAGLLQEVRRRGGQRQGRVLVRAGAGHRRRPRLVVVGHIDEIGLHVTHIEDDGYLRFGEVGGWDPRVLVGQRVRMMTRGGVVPGVIARKPIHLLKDEDRKKAPELKELHIDIGAKAADEARELVRIGDVAVIDAGPLEMRNDRVVARALDNRVGCYVAAESARLVAESGGAPGDVIALAVTQEETSFAGAAHERLRTTTRTSRSWSTSPSPPISPASSSGR